MSLPLKMLLKAAIRIEKKLDELLKLVVPMAQQPGMAIPPRPQPLNVPSQGACTLCQAPVTYQNLIDPETVSFLDRIDARTIAKPLDIPETLRKVDTRQALISFVGMNLFYLITSPIISSALETKDEKKFQDKRPESIVDLFMHGIRKR